MLGAVIARRVCVFLSSSSGSRPDYADAARELGRALATSGRTLIYGGASVGLMAVLADAALAAGGEVVGVIPEPLVLQERAHRGLTALHVVPSMHARKARMYAEADAFLVMPGGFGTLEETFEILTSQQIGLHAKPLCLVDVAGFWRPMLGFLEHAVAEGTLLAENLALLGVAVGPEAALAWVDERCPT
jgi:uncharacterized protein (TIGR00730 family)